MEKSFKIADRLGYFKDFAKDVISEKKIKKFPFSRLTLIVAGSYGQSDSALERISRGRHRLVRLKKGDVVIFSADPSPPSVILNVNNMIDNLTRLGVDVFYYEIQENLHVSGHGSKEDLKLLLALVKPKFAIPIGGNPRHQRAYGFLAQEMGIASENIFEVLNGEILEFKDGRAKATGKIKLKKVFTERNKM